MRTGTRRYAPLATIALIGWGAYILACRPAFSPDGKSILLPVLDPDLRVLLYDREKESFRTVFETPGTEIEEANAVALWTPNGESALVLWVRDRHEDEIQVAQVPVRGSGPVRHFTLEADKVEGMLAYPAFVRGNTLLLGLPGGIGTVDLATGKTGGIETGGTTALAATADRVYYLSWEEKEGERRESWALGSLDLASSEPTELHRIEGEDAPEGLGFFAATGDEPRFALSHEKGVLLLGKEERRLLPAAMPEGLERPRFGNVVWSPTGDVLYAACVDEPRFGVLEITVETGDARWIPICEEHMNEDTAVLVRQIALAPDGSALGVLTLRKRDETGEDGSDALWLVDLRAEGRPVRKVPIPPRVPSASK